MRTLYVGVVMKLTDSTRRSRLFSVDGHNQCFPDNAKRKIDTELVYFHLKQQVARTAPTRRKSHACYSQPEASPPSFVLSK